MSKSDLQAQIRSIHKKGHTGILRVRAGGWPDLDLFFMGGDLIACGCPDDGASMGALLVAAGAVDEETLAIVLDDLSSEQDLADILVQEAEVAGDAVMAARANLFEDNLAWAAIAPDASIDFEGQDMVFPPNMQFGRVVKDLLAELKKWLKAASPALDALHDGQDYGATGEAPDGTDDDLWAALSTPAPLSVVVALIGPPRRAAMVRAADLLKSGALSVAAEEEPVPTEDLDDDEGELVDLPAVDDLDEFDDALDELDDDLVGFDAEVEDDPELAALDAPEAAGLPEDDDEAKDHITQEDYERAARGEFIKSYDVLDKVDLSGVKVLGAEKAGAPEESIPAIEAIAADFDDEDSAIELGDMDSMEGIAAIADEDFEEPLASDTRPEVAPVAVSTDDVELLSDDFAIFDGIDDAEAPPVQDVVDFEAEDDALSEEPLAAVVLDEDEDAGATGTFNLDDDVGVFDREQLNDFHHRIDVFNNIFRIIFKSFSEHIGADKSQQRFNALLGSSQRQYPELFQNLAVDTDGSIRPAPLINNLSNCPPGDYGSLLHQGLYELIFSHLYDAKDMLPGNAETEMMEQIVVFERQLHQM